jgi:predicted MFS family arabinose efflux permease
MTEFTKLPKGFLLVLILIFFNASGGMLPILITMFLKEIGFDVKEIGFFIALFGVGGFLGGYIGGQMVDYFSSKGIVSFSIMGNAIFITLLGLFKSSFAIAICMFCAGFFNSSFRPSAILLMFERMGGVSKSTALSFRRVVLNFGFSVSSVVFGFLFQKQHQFAFVIIGFVFFLNFILSLFLKKIKCHKAQQEGEVKPPHSSFFIFCILNLMLLLGIMVLEQYKTTYVMFLQDYANFTVFEVSFLFTIHGVLILIFQIPVGFVCDKIKPSIGCFIGSIMLAIGIGLTFLVDNFFIGVLLCAFWTFSEMILFPIMLPYILNTSIYKKGKTMGIYQASFSLGVFFSPIFGSFFYQINPNLLWILCLIICLICSAVFLIFYQLYDKNSSSI